MKEFLIIFVTTSGRDEAEKIAMQLINSGSSPCVNILPPCLSIYQWKGAIHRDEEVLMMIKSEKAEFESVSRIVTAAHSYDVPEIIAVPLSNLSSKYRSYLEGYFEMHGSL
jgi:periplasmic divalent cation tolerance protein